MSENLEENIRDNYCHKLLKEKITFKHRKTQGKEHDRKSIHFRAEYWLVSLGILQMHLRQTGIPQGLEHQEKKNGLFFQLKSKTNKDRSSELSNGLKTKKKGKKRF